ncbi:hypothetical protein [Microbacterium sp. ZW T5_56]|uniref:hypothetical protein n=1 Tax=Microbacterium sp. ZW T5_56 TaxID=3378081 RepID=UPI003852E4A9
MAKQTDVQRKWSAERRLAARRRGLRYHGGPYIVDDVYICSFSSWIGRTDRRTGLSSISWEVKVKPRAIDEVYWAAVVPGKTPPRVPVHRHLSGLSASPLSIARGSMEVSDDDPADWEGVFDEFERARLTFIEETPTLAAFADLVVDPARNRSVHDLRRQICTLAAAGRVDDALTLLAAAIAGGNRGSYFWEAGEFEYLDAYLRGPAAYVDFREALRPTHTMTYLEESRPRISITISRNRDRNGFLFSLSRLDGTERWAIILDADGGVPNTDVAQLRYIQCAGSAERMTVEVCLPGASVPGFVAIQSVVGRHVSVAQPIDQTISLPSVEVTVAAHEVFDAAAAAELFDAFFLADDLPPGFALRPLGGFTADGERIDFPQQGWSRSKDLS